MAATTWLLLNEGYAATTLEAVARRAGMAKKTVYRYASDREDLVAQVVRGWTDGFAPVMAQDVTSVDEVLPALARVLQAIAERVLSANAVGMFRLLTADFPGRDALLRAYQENGIERGTAMLAAWFQRPSRGASPGERAPRRGRPAAVHGDRRTAARHGAGADAAAARKLDR
ncbi:helix-turn-helix domain-containing protein [Achromobacter xylosoxidans]